MAIKREKGTGGAGSAPKGRADFVTGPGLTRDELAALGGNTYGGQAPILGLDVGGAAGPFTYTGSKMITTHLGQKESHLAHDDDGNPYRLPMSATFTNALAQAALRIGDRFAVTREEDVVQKNGPGKGKTIPCYSLTVIERVGAPLV